MLIKPLSKETIQLINSTQIISSIYGAIKELVENSLDAQAHNIEVNLVNNGLSLIEVKDNGSGISKVDAQFMALPSYTSKISNFLDLDLLSTYGFRGEGLTAICQVADVTICTKTNNEETMTCYTLDNEGHVVDSELSHGLTGTTVKMKNLFKNMPVRRNILNNKKRISQEIRTIEILLKTYAICKPSIRFMFRVNSNTIFSKPSCKDIFEALKSVLGTQAFFKLAFIEKNFAQTKIQLFIPKKDIKNFTDISQIGLQFVCINDRPIKSKEIEKQIKKRISEYFNRYISNCQKFIFCLILKVDSSMLDVNLEPNKDKVFLQNEGAVLNEIDKSLISFYELTDSEVSTKNNVENINFNKNLNESEEEAKDEWIICKKQKINETNMTNKNIFNLNENKDCDLNKFDDFLTNISGPILSDSDSNDMGKSNENKNKKNNECIPETCSKNNSLELFNFTQDILKKNQIIEESLSQLPEVDLGEDFDWKDIIKNNKSSLIEKSNAEQITDVIWSKGQISGLQSGVYIVSDSKINTINHKDKYHENQEVQLVSESFNFIDDIKQINDSEKLISNGNVPIGEDDEFDWKLIMKNSTKRTPIKKSKHKLNNNSPNAHINSTQTKIPFAGENAYLRAQPSAFAIYCTTKRSKIIKQYPEFTPTEIAAYMNNQWKQISLEECKYYRNLTNQKIQNTSNSSISQIFRKKKSEPTQAEKDKNKKQFVSMLGNMKTNKTEVKTRSMIMRTFRSWNINTSLVTEKFKKPVVKIEKSIVGSLNSLLWIINLTSNLFVFDITELEAQLNVKDYNITQINVAYVEDLIDQWFVKKNDMSIFHPFHSF